jgi:hypothetical protein
LKAPTDDVICDDGAERHQARLLIHLRAVRRNSSLHHDRATQRIIIH